MQYLPFRDMVKSFLNRKNLLDPQIDQFVEMAKLRLQREYDMNLVSTRQTFVYPATQNVGILLPTNFKKFPYEGAVNIITPNGMRLPVDGSTYAHEQFRLSRTRVPTTPYPAGSNSPSDLRFYILPINDTIRLFLNPEPASVSLDCYYYVWMAPYAAASEDFLLRSGHDVLLYAVLEVANLFEFEENRIPIDEAAFSSGRARLDELASKLTHSGGPIMAD